MIACLLACVCVAESNFKLEKHCQCPAGATVQRDFTGKLEPPGLLLFESAADSAAVSGSARRTRRPGLRLALRPSLERRRLSNGSVNMMPVRRRASGPGPGTQQAGISRLQFLGLPDEAGG